MSSFYYALVFLLKHNLNRAMLLPLFSIYISNPRHLQPSYNNAKDASSKVFVA